MEVVFARLPCPTPFSRGLGCVWGGRWEERGSAWAWALFCLFTVCWPEPLVGAVEVLRAGWVPAFQGCLG